MDFKEEIKYDKTYLIVHEQGYDEFSEIGIVGAFDTKQEADAECKRLWLENNSEEERRSTWTNNHYSIRINSATEDGKKLTDNFGKGVEALFEYAKAHPEEYNVYEGENDCGFAIQKMPELEDKKVVGEKDENLMSYRMIIMDFSKKD